MAQETLSLEEIEEKWEKIQGNWAERENIRKVPWEIGKTYYFRLATYAWCGTVVAVGKQEIVLSPAAYVFDSGRFTDAMKNGLESENHSEMDPVDHPVVIGRGALVDATPYDHPVPTEQK